MFSMKASIVAGWFAHFGLKCTKCVVRRHTLWVLPDGSTLLHVRGRGLGAEEQLCKHLDTYYPDWVIRKAGHSPQKRL